MHHHTTRVPCAHVLRSRVERIDLRRLSPTYGFADVRLEAVHLRGLKIEQAADGRVSIRVPEQTDSAGRARPLYSLQPGWREAVEAEVLRMWQHAGMRR